MKINRKFTQADVDVYSTFDWSMRSSKITNTDGSLVFEMSDAEIPSNWSQLATDIMVSKYFRKAGVPQLDKNNEPILNNDGVQQTGPEKSVKQVVKRLTGCWRWWGEENNYFDSKIDAEAFEDELTYMLLDQMAAPNSPQWFNTGLNWAYGISGPPQGHYIANHTDGKITRATDSYSHPQPHACFIQSVDDSLVGENGIMDLWQREARLFKYGSGTGTNFSSIRGSSEALSGGGHSSGLMSFLKIGDRAAGAIKSGGTTRRAAKMVCLDADHPDIEEFVNWKVREELKVAALVEGMKHLSQNQKISASELNLNLDYDFNGESYQTVSGQNSNNSIRLSHQFFTAVEQNDKWNLTARTDGSVTKTIPARSLWDQICKAAWQCADPGLQYDSTINDWHTCPSDGRINASNPCSEYMFLDDTACNLASINLLKFYDNSSKTFNVENFEHAIRLWTIVLEISVLMAAFPSKSIAEKSWKFRTLGLGYANLGALLMQCGLPYDSEESRAICGSLTSILTGRSYAVSSEMASEQGPFDGFLNNKEPMLRVIRNHRRAAYGESRSSGTYEKLSAPPVPIDSSLFKVDKLHLNNAEQLLAYAQKAWDDALSNGEKYGYRNAQVSVIAPTGTIGLLMDCDTTGVEPDFALTKFKKLAGGGYFKIANQSIAPALEALNYTKKEVNKILSFVMGELHFDIAMPSDAIPREFNDIATFRDFLIHKGFTNETIKQIELLLPGVFELSHAFSAWSLPLQAFDALGLDQKECQNNVNFNGLQALGIKNDSITELNRLICGNQTVEGNSGIKEEHLAVFDCANICGDLGTRFIPASGHIRMMAAAQPFISGAISKTINLPNEATVEDVQSSYWLSWELGLKANALYRDGCKLSQPLSSSSDTDLMDEDENTEEIDSALREVALEVTSAAHQMENEPMYVDRVVERIVERPLRRRLPDTRRSLTHHFNVAGHEGYLTVGMYEDGSPGELFITMSKEGSTIGGLMDSLGTAISVALQYGVPVESLVTKFAHQRFEPQGMTTNREIPFAKSLVDYIFRWLGMQFIEGYREQHAPPNVKRETNDRITAKKMTTKPSPKKKDEESSWNHTSKEQKIQGRTTKSSQENFLEKIATSPSKGQSSPLQSFSEKAEATQLEAGVTTSILSQSTASIQSDAPACDGCGSITVRNGTCYRCLNCGNSMGCS